MADDTRHCTAFEGTRRLAGGGLASVAAKTRQAIDQGAAFVLVFDDATGAAIDIDWRGTPAEMLRRLAARDQPPAPATGEGSGPGRPKLGVVAREVTLLPRHWDWLADQPSGASVALRRLVEAARRGGAAGDLADRARRAREGAYRFMAAMAGNNQGFEEATRALFAADKPRFEAQTQGWPVDVRDHARRMAADGFAKAGR